MKYKNWLIGALLLAVGALTSNPAILFQGAGAIATAVEEQSDG